MDDSADAVLGPLRRPLVAALALYVGDRGVAEELAQEASVADTALAKGCAEGTVKSLTHKALAALRGAGLEEVALDA